MSLKFGLLAVIAVCCAASDAVSQANPPKWLATRTTKNNGNRMFLSDSTSYSWGGSRMNNTALDTLPYEEYNSLSYDTLTASWKPEKKISRTYDSKDRLILEVEQRKIGSRLYNFRKTEYWYDTLSRNQRILEQKWVSGAWALSWKDTFMYDPINKKIYQTPHYTWDGVFWQPQSNVVYSYDPGTQRLVGRNHYLRKSGEFVKDYREYWVPHFDRPDSLWRMRFDAVKNDWFKMDRWVYKYDVNGMDKDITYQLYLYPNGYVDTSKVHITTDPDGNRIQYDSFLYQGGSFKAVFAESTTYNINNRKESVIVQSGLGTLTNQTRRTTSYFKGHYVQNDQTDLWNGSAWAPSYKAVYSFYPPDVPSWKREYGYRGGAWVEDAATEYFYDVNFNTSVQKLLSKPATVYPNPSEGNSFIRFVSERSMPAVMKVYSQNGSVILTRYFMTETGYNEEALEMGGRISKGIYFLEISSGNTRYSGKLIIR